jgi:hypothetical protein
VVNVFAVLRIKKKTFYKLREWQRYILGFEPKILMLEYFLPILLYSLFIVLD